MRPVPSEGAVWREASYLGGPPKIHTGEPLVPR